VRVISAVSGLNVQSLVNDVAARLSEMKRVEREAAEAVAAAQEAILNG